MQDGNEMAIAEPDRFVRLADGTIYGYSEMLARKKGASVVDGYVAATYFRSVGVENDITKRYPSTLPVTRRPVAQPQLASKQQNRNAMKAEREERRTQKLAERAEKLKRLNGELDPIAPYTPDTEVATSVAVPDTAMSELDPELAAMVGDLLNHGEDGSQR